MIVPLSLVCTERMSKIRQIVTQNEAWLSSYDMRPNSLFEGVSQRLTIVLGRNTGDGETNVFTGGYRRWAAEERNHLLVTTEYLALAKPGQGDLAIPKLRVPIEASVLVKIGQNRLGNFTVKQGEPFWVHRIVRYFVKAVDFIPVFRSAAGTKGKSEDYKEFIFEQGERTAVIATLNSSLFYWFWRCHGDGFHCGYHDVYFMPFRRPEAPVRKSLAGLHRRLMTSFQNNSSVKEVATRTGKIQYQEFSPKPSKPIIDEIDRALAEHYGFSDEELDFIVNYDAKYRMGAAGGDAEDDE